MRIIADLHIHSRYSRATSSRLTPAYLDRWARIKGINLIGSGDCTHPRWLQELRENFDDAEQGLYTLKRGIRAAFDAGPALAEGLPRPHAAGDGALRADGTGAGKLSPRFALSGEICTIYKRGEKTRKVHHLIILPDFRAAAALQTKLERVGNISSDGRPILGIDSRELLAMLLEADERSMLIPAHIWTPWFSALGAKSGFDSIGECYGDLAAHIPAVETGLSSDPPMNWALSSLDPYAIISNSDAHSPDKLGREATILETELSFAGLRRAIFPVGGTGADISPDVQAQAPAGIIATIEFFPEEGKYHYDGHRKCGVRLGPEDAAESVNGEKICPVCGKALTRGVMGRVAELADRAYDGAYRLARNETPQTRNRRPFHSLIPLKEILGELLGTGPASKKVDAAYGALIEKAGSEFAVLMDMSVEEIGRIRTGGLSGELLGEAVGRMRRGQVSITAGYDGEYGVVRVFPPGADMTKSGKSLFGEADATDADSVAHNEIVKDAVAPNGNMGGTPAGNGIADGAVAPDDSRAAAIAPNGQKPAAKKTAKRHETKSDIKQKPNAEATIRFDAAQEAIINHAGDRAIVIAGPGTGKTAVLAAKIAKLVSEGAEAAPAPGASIPGASILALSFTVKAAAELRERIGVLLGKARAGETAAGAGITGAVCAEAQTAACHTATFHSFCGALLREQAGNAGVPENFAIADESQRDDLLREVCESRGKKTGSGRLGRYIEERKRFLLLPGEEKPKPAIFDSLEDIPPVPKSEPEMEELYGLYRGRLRDLGLLDFDDLIAGTARLFASRPDILAGYRRRLRYIFVDEYQDINLSQYILLRLLADGGTSADSAAAADSIAAGGRPSLWVIGDPNQAIYGFRGSDKRFIDRFARDYPGASRFELARSFRCAESIIGAAGQLTGAPLKGTGRPVDLYRVEYLSDKAEAEGVARAISRLIGGASFFALDTASTDDTASIDDTASVADSDDADSNDARSRATDSGADSGTGIAHNVRANGKAGRAKPAAGHSGALYADTAAPGDCAVLIRAAPLAAPVVKALTDHGIPFVVSGEKPWWEEEPFAPFLARVRERAAGGGAAASSNTAAQEEFEKERGNPRMARLFELAAMLGGVQPLLDALALSGAESGSEDGIGGVGREGVKIMTIHAAKGLEFNHVFVIGLEDGILPFTLYGGDSPSQYDEEKRLLYVAMTRARIGLSLSWARSRNFRGRILRGGPSPFLGELEKIVPLLEEKRAFKKEKQLSLF